MWSGVSSLSISTHASPTVAPERRCGRRRVYFFFVERPCSIWVQVVPSADISSRWAHGPTNEHANPIGEQHGRPQPARGLA
jgi:hypothetical protein